LDRAVTFNIAPQPLDLALIAFSQQAHIQVIIAPDAAGTVETPALHGTVPARVALDVLLRNSGLKYAAVGKSVSVTRVADSGDSPTSQSGVKPGAVADSATPTQPTHGSAASPEHVADHQGPQTFESNKTTDRERERGNRLEEIVVTAQKREERLKDVPISIAVLGGQDLERSSFDGVTEALNTVPGVTASPNFATGGTFIAIRGVGASGPFVSGASPISYYLDSAPFGYIRNAIFPDPNVYDLERIEVLRGPQGTLYGASAENGLVRVLTHDANLDKFEFKARGSMSGTSNGGSDNYAGDMAANVPIVEGRLAARAVVGYAHESGWINAPAVSSHINDAESRNVRLKVNARPSDNLSIGLALGQQSDHVGAPNSSSKDGVLLTLIPEPIAIKTDNYGLKVAYNFPRFSVASMTSYIDHTDDITADLGLGSLDNVGIGVPLFSNLHSKVFTQEVVLNSLSDRVWHWTVGAVYRDVKEQLVQNIPAIISFSFTDTSKSYAGYGQIGSHFLDDKFDLTVGLRYFHDDVSDRGSLVPDVAKESFHATTPRAALSWYPTKDVSIYSSYSEGFRSGVVQLQGLVPAGFPAAKPDKLHNYEVGAKGDLLSNLISFDSAVYYIKWNNVQQLIGVPYEGLDVSGIVNSRSASGPGVEFGVTVRPIVGFDLSANIGWNDLKLDAGIISQGFSLFVKGDRLNYSSEFTGGVSGNYTFPIGGGGFQGRLSAAANYGSKQAVHLIGASGPLVNAGDSLLIARAAFFVLTPDHWGVTLYIDNLTNENGSVPSNVDAGNGLGARPRPRTIGVQLDYHL
jgi:outer membrane receptor protein involved in Fe transport